MEQHEADFTNTFRYLTINQFENISFYHTTEFQKWFQNWTRQLGYRSLNTSERLKLMEQHNPNIIPRNHLVEEALLNASKQNDYQLFNQLLTKLKNPFNYKENHQERFLIPIKTKTPFVTYCGT